MKRALLFAYPAWHSLSPAMHNAAFAALGLDARYEAREVSPAELATAVEELRSDEILGANVTIPHKERILELLDRVTPESRAVGAVNTVLRQGGELIGHNTDVGGFTRSLAELGFDCFDRRVLLLGAGGAARAVAYALLMAGVKELMIHNRTVERAESLAADLASFGELTVVDDRLLRVRAPTAELVVNATSVGMMKAGMALDETPLPADLLPGSGAVVDLVYRPARTRLLRESEAAGLAVQNGLPMLVYQGAAAFTLWTGQEAPASIMRDAALKMLQG